MEQELWGVVLAYNLLRFMMAQMMYNLKGIEPYQIDFKQASLYLSAQLSLLPAVSPGKIPKIINEIRPWRKVLCYRDAGRGITHEQ